MATGPAPAAPGRGDAALVVAAVSVAEVGFTHLYLGVHWFSEVLGGRLLRAALVTPSIAAYQRWITDARR
ncbi:hypothetical protein [Streptomyces sannanensis]|uniref:hypothetical protein n=1 Tax=Streptomyces sannanensis TaxID=285536 RepID=UPI0031EC4ED9